MLTEGQQPWPQHDSPALQYVLAQQLELDEMQKGATEGSGGIQQVSGTCRYFSKVCSAVGGQSQENILTIWIEALAAHRSTTNIKVTARYDPDASGGDVSKVRRLS